ncbi:putative ATPase/DNA-binding SARP family transcriptional activator [Kibdelosporangium banguiense]|uniref:ATPase/DNA-binding SARP family transcriptional activator n=1 Tax=Kibdelosporangium banguiense TaxID=1365924 RepID=A0ABS4TMY6_9PSEU|nr:BTAD domain-containing putative transcriptional regulator [Kibdelosporangium banguiense]MBP2325776.1 putative ATPase/DNA-binding SARP family transcriptional activator [Kibdelosporangium banguiense]
MRFGILGTVEIRSADGEVLPLGGPRQRALLALLLLDAGRVVTVERLLDGMYGSQPPAGAMSALQSQVSRLRRGLPPDLIEFHPAGYRIALEPEAVDVHRFEHLARQGARALAETDHAQAAALLKEALDLWRGPVLADVPLTEAISARLNELRLSATEDLFDAQLALGEHAALISELRAQVEAHPLRERLRGQLMLALYAGGRQAEALAEFENARRTLEEELGADPSAELSAIHLAVLRGEPDPRSNVPAQLTSFVGRADELDRIVAMLADSRLVTVTGPGGAGKTRLAIEVAGLQARETYFVDLAAVSHGADIPQAMLSALGVRDAGLFGTLTQDTTSRVIAALADRHVLLIMDNCEHVIAHAAGFVHRLLTACPGLRVLATSREALAITGEHLCPLPSLPEPAAVRLFTDRAAAVSPGFHVHAGNAETVKQICEALDGMPLAIELAAARLRSLEIAEVAARLEDRFALLSRGARTASPRHRTLRAAVEWSWDLLDPDEQLLAARLTVFAGSATLAAAEQVCGMPATADLLSSLVDKSLVENVGGRYRMLDTIRAFCAEHLTEDMRRAHATYFYELAETADPHLRRAEQLEWLSRLDADHGNIQAALRWAVSNDTTLALQMFGAISPYWYLRGLRGQATPLATELLTRIGTQPPDDLDEEYVLCVLHAAWSEIDAPHWHDHLKHAESIMRQPRGAIRRAHSAFLWAVATGPPKGEPQRPLLDDDTWSESFATLGFAMLNMFDGEIVAAQADLAKALAGFRAVGDRWGLITTLDTLAQLADSRGDDQAFLDLLTEAMDLVGQLGSVDDTVTLLCRRADNLVRGGNFDAARADYEHAATLARRIGTSDQLAAAYSGLGEIARFDGDPANARRLQELALSTCTKGPFGLGSPQARVLIALARLVEAEGDISSAGAHYHQAIAIALEHRHLPFVARGTDGLASLALREGNAEHAALLLGAAIAIRGMPLIGDPDITRVTDQAIAVIGKDAFTAAFERGAALTREQALSLIGK